MGIRRLMIALGASALALGLGGAQASPPSDEAILAPFETLRMTAELARWARQHGDALALTTAARIRRGQPLTSVTRDGAEAAGEPGAAWLDEAELMAAGDPVVLTLIETARREGTKGREGGPRVSTARVGGGRTNRYLEPFQGGRPAVVYVEGDGDTDLSLRVRHGETLACADTRPGDIKMCVWKPRAGARYTVEVINGGIIDNDYALATN